MTEYNLPLLRKERDWVIEQRSLPSSLSQLDMDWWYCEDPALLETHGKECGTTYCIAGHIAACSPGIQLWRASSWVLSNGQLIDLPLWARDQLGLSDSEAAGLFYAENDNVLGVLDEIIDRAERLERIEAEQSTKDEAA